MAEETGVPGSSICTFTNLFVYFEIYFVQIFTSINEAIEDIYFAEILLILQMQTSAIIVIKKRYWKDMYMCACCLLYTSNGIEL